MMQEDLPAAVDRVADFLGVADPAVRARAAAHASREHMLAVRVWVGMWACGGVGGWVGVCLC